DDTWVVATPDLDVFAEDLHAGNPDLVGFHRTGANGGLPPGIPVASIYGFGPLTQQQLLRIRVQAQGVAAAARAALGVVAPGVPVVQGAAPPPLLPPPGLAPVAGLGGPARALARMPMPLAGPPPPAGLALPVGIMIWISVEGEPPYQKGDILVAANQPLPPNTLQQGLKAMMPLAGGGYILAKNIEATRIQEYKFDDLRVLPVHFDAQGIRRREFASAVLIMSDLAPQGGGLQLRGPGSALPLLKTMRDQSLTPAMSHEYWVRNSKIPEGDRSVYEHEMIMRVLDSMITVDQLNVPCLQSAELLLRRAQVIKEAHRISPGLPDYSSADIYMGWAYRQRGAGIDQALTAHVSAELKAEAAIAKEARKAREVGSKSDCAPRCRDLFPLPHIREKDHVSFLVGGAKRRQARREHNLRDANRVIKALNGMYAPPSVDTNTEYSLAQCEAQREILIQVAQAPKPVHMQAMREAAHELLRTSLSYTKEEAESTVRSYDERLVSIPDVAQGKFPHAVDVIDPTGREIIMDPLNTMLLAPDEWGAVVESGKRVVPYMDAVLSNDPAKYISFIRGLFDRGMIRFVSHSLDRITPFFVVKKNGKLRLVLDCRRVNMRFKKCPPVAMAAGYSWSQVQLGPDETLYTAQSDIKDYFYSLGMPLDLQPYFCLPHVPGRMLQEWGIDPAGMTDDRGMAHPCFIVVPMGWNWAMWIAQRVHQFQAMQGSGLGFSRVLVDGAPPPDLASGEPMTIPYAGNLNVTGACKEKVQRAKDGAVKRLRDCGFLVHEEMDACDMVQSLGFTVDGKTGVVRPVAEKLQKVIRAFEWMSHRPRVTGKAVEKLLGHAVHFMMLRRELLSIFRSLYDFVHSSYSKRQRLWASAAKEASWAASLLLICSADLKLPWAADVTISDASLSGIAVCSRLLKTDQVSQLGSQHERWRYKGAMPAVSARESAFAQQPLDPFTDPASVMPLRGVYSPAIVSDEFELNPLFIEVPHDILQESDWTFQYATQMTFKEHITLIEGRGTISAMRHKLRSISNFSKKHLHFGDNFGIRQWEHERTAGLSDKDRRQEELFKLKKQVRDTCYPRPNQYHRQDVADIGWNDSSSILVQEHKGAAPERAAKRAKFAQERIETSRFQGQSLLEQEAVGPETAVLYAQLTAEFDCWAINHGLPTGTVEEIDLCLNGYINEAYMKGKDLHDATKMLAAVLDRRQDLKESLPRSRRSLQGYRKLDPGLTRPPMAWELVALIALTMISKDVMGALAVLVMFVTYIRPGEALSLKESDLIPPSASSTFHSLNLHSSDRAELSKMGMADESMLLDSQILPYLGELLSEATGRDPTMPLFRMNYQELKTKWDAAQIEIEMPKKFVLHQLRHSGPSHDRLMKYRSAAEVKTRGRWASDSAARRYEAHARVQQEFLWLPEPLRRRAMEAPKLLLPALKRAIKKVRRRR
ncbi:unnamed protein product, partial [Polarella glacialis]